MQLLLVLLPYSLLILFFFFLLRLLKQHKNRANPKLPPGPWQLPFIGSIHHIALGALTHHSFRALAYKYGPLFHIKLGQVRFIVASNTSAACEILKTHDTIFASRPTMLAIKTIAYDSLGMGFSPYGPYWRQLRKICTQELLSLKKVRSFGHIRDEEARKLAEMIGVSAGSKVNMTEMFLGSVNGIITRAAFGKEFVCREKFLAALKETLALLPLLKAADLFPAFGYLISAVDGSRARMVKARREIDALLDEIIAEHSAKKEGRKEGGEGEVEEDFVDVLLRVKEKGELQFPLRLENVKAVIFDILVGATESTSATLDWAMTELIRHPEAMLKAQIEVREVCAGKKMIEESDINELRYLKLIIKETLRMHPPLPLLIPRTCTKETEVLGFTIPKNSWVAVNVWAIGRDPAIWENPDAFFPDRFKGFAVDFKGGSYEYLPFGGGCRICPGMAFGLAGLERILALLLLRFDWELPDGRDPKLIDVDEGLTGSARRKNDLYLIATPYPPKKMDSNPLEWVTLWIKG